MSQVLIQGTTSGLWSWAVLDDSGQITDNVQGSLVDLASALHNHGQKLVTLVLPGFDVVYRSLRFLDKERKHLDKTVLYSLEDDVLGDVDELHLVMARPEGNVVQVAAIEEVTLNQWQQRLAEAGIAAQACLPEQALLPERDWLLFVDEQRALLRVRAGETYCLELAQLPLALALLTDEYSELPERIDLVYPHGIDADIVRTTIPESLHHLLKEERKSLFALVAPQVQRKHPLNLFQGRFATATEWAKHWRQWRGVAMLAGLFCLVQVVMSAVHVNQLSALADAQQARIESLHRDVFPRGQMVDPRQQLKNELNRLQGSGGGGGFVALLQDVGGVLKDLPGLEINSINYDDTTSEVRLDVLVKDFQQAEQIKAGVEQKGLKYQLQNSNAQGDALRARIQISRGGAH